MDAGSNDAKRWFASDNNASVHPAVMEALARANHGHAVGYGDDPISVRASALFKETFGQNSETYLVWNGTGANVMALSAVLRPWEGVVCSEHAHIATDETGAPERVAGVKLFTLPTPDGKISPKAVEERIAELGWVHSNLPRMVSISQTTEMGTVYTLDELAALGEVCRVHGLLLHVDGARLSNAAVSLGVGLREAAGPADLISFGGTKNGLMCGEALVFMDPELARGAGNLRKNVLQLASKMRFLSAQYEVYLEQELWRTNAMRANALARRLEAGARREFGIEPAFPVDANAVFAQLPAGVMDRVLDRWFFYAMDSSQTLVRWMCSWDNEEDDVDAFLADLAAAMPPSL